MVDLKGAGQRLAAGVNVETPSVEMVRSRAEHISRRRRLVAGSAVAIAALADIAAGIASTRGGSDSSLLVVTRPNPGASDSSPSASPKTSMPSAPSPLIHSPVPVPRVIGMSVQAANLTLDRVDLGIEISLVDSDSVDPGVVVSQEPAPGAVTTTFSSAVKVAISDGPTEPLPGPSCVSGDLRLDFGSPVSEATGQHTTDLVLTNISNSICKLFGYPAVTLLDEGGRALPFEYSHTGDQMTTAARPRVVSLRPGWSAYVRINKYRCDVHADDTSAVLRLALPGASPSLSANLSGPPLDYCAETASTVVTVSPFESTEFALFGRH